MLDGARGPALRLAMRILHAVGHAHDAPDLIAVRSAHVGLSLSSLGEAGVELLESLTAAGAHFAVPTTTNVLSVGREEALEQATPDAALQGRALAALVRLGAIPSCSCNPFVQGHAPRAGDSVAWSESASAPFVNGVLGARTNREGATALASALTGLTPRYGMHLDECRRGGMLFSVTAVPEDVAGFSLLGAAIGRRCESRVPVLLGMRPSPPNDCLYAFCAALATYSSVATFHMVGVTPEAPTLQAVFPDGAPNAIVVDDAARCDERERVNRFDPECAEVVVIGCPHASVGQLAEIAALLAGRGVAPGRRLVVHTNAEVLEAARHAGTLGVLEAAGVEVTVGTCTYVATSGLPPGTRLATDSAKMAFLMASRGLATAVATTGECVGVVVSSS